MKYGISDIKKRWLRRFCLSCTVIPLLVIILVAFVIDIVWGICKETYLVCRDQFLNIYVIVLEFTADFLDAWNK